MSNTVLVPKGAITGKGYLLTKNAAGDLVAIAPGANGKILSADSTAASGLAWVDPPAGGAIADGSISVAKLSFDPATQTELNAVNSALDARLDALEAGGGGGGGITGPRPLAFKAGSLYVAAQQDGGNHSWLNTQVNAVPFTAGRTTTLTLAGTKVNVAGSAGKQLRFAIFTDGGGWPKDLVDDSGLEAADVLGVIGTAGNLAAPVVAGGIYWALMKVHGAGGTDPQTAGTSAGGHSGYIPVAPDNVGVGASLKADMGSATAGFPASFAEGDWFVADQGPTVSLLAAA